MKVNKSIKWRCLHCIYAVKSRDRMREHLKRVHKISEIRWHATRLSLKQFEREELRWVPLLSISQQPETFHNRDKRKRRPSDLSFKVSLYDESGDNSWTFYASADLYDRKHRLPALLRDLGPRIAELEQMSANALYQTSGGLERDIQRRQKEEKA
jgi:hypothetical protein